MTNNQAHGKKFEDFIKACGLFAGAADAGRSPIASFDIEARFDRRRNLATSIKATGNSGVGLSDARRFFGIDQPFRMIVGKYSQHAGRKITKAVYEFIFSVECLSQLRGDLNLSDITRFHDGLLLAKFPVGSHLAARRWATQQKVDLAAKRSMIILNPKIDSKNQRRLQCSVRLVDLIEVADRFGEFTLHTESIGDFVLPFEQISSKREFG